MAVGANPSAQGVGLVAALRRRNLLLAWLAGLLIVGLGAWLAEPHVRITLVAFADDEPREAAQQADRLSRCGQRAIGPTITALRQWSWSPKRVFLIDASRGMGPNAHRALAEEVDRSGRDHPWLVDALQSAFADYSRANVGLQSFESTKHRHGLWLSLSLARRFNDVPHVRRGATWNPEFVNWYSARGELPGYF